MHPAPRPLAAALLTLGAVGAHAQFQADPARDFLARQLEATPELGFDIDVFVPFPQVDSVALAADLDDNGDYTRIGAATFTRAGGQVQIEQSTSLDGETRTRSLAGPIDVPADGSVAYAETLTVRDDGEAARTFDLTHTGTFAGGHPRVAVEQDVTSFVIDAVSTDTYRYYYDDAGRLTAQGETGAINGIPFPGDSSVYRYGLDGTVFVQEVFSPDDDDPDVFVGSDGAFHFVRESDDLLLAHTISSSGDTLSTFRYRFRGGVLDSFVLVADGFGEALGIVRSDDGSRPRVRSYDYFATFGITGPAARATYYFNADVNEGGGGTPPNSTSSARELPEVPVALRMPNPVPAGATYGVRGELPDGAALRITALDGRVLAQADPSAPQTWPALPAGPYLVTVAAPGYRPHVEVVVAVVR